MKTKTILGATAVVAVLAVAGGSVVYAKQSTEVDNDAVHDLGLAKITLAQAVLQAEAHAGGKASKAELESEHGTVAFDVEVVTAQQQVFDVRVSAIDGTVLASKTDTADGEDRDDEDEHDHDRQNQHKNDRENDRK